MQEGEVALPDDADDSAAKPGSNYDAVVEQLKNFGFAENLCKHAAIATNGNAELAVNWILENSENPQYLEAPANNSTQANDGDTLKRIVDQIHAENDGEGKYRLRGFVSHMGRNTESGHYVCHIFDDASKEWAIFNDEKVAVSEEVPFNHGYLYFYERI